MEDQFPAQPESLELHFTHPSRWTAQIFLNYPEGPRRYVGCWEYHKELQHLIDSWNAVQIAIMTDDFELFDDRYNGDPIFDADDFFVSSAIINHGFPLHVHIQSRDKGIVLYDNRYPFYKLFEFPPTKSIRETRDLWLHFEKIVRAGDFILVDEAHNRME